MITAILARIFRRQKPVEVIATAEYFNSETGAYDDTRSTHMVAFCLQGDKRIIQITTATEMLASMHPCIIRDGHHWMHHGDLPSFAYRVRSQKADLVVLNGGRA